jgi:hypothetical protein
MADLTRPELYRLFRLHPRGRRPALTRGRTIAKTLAGDGKMFEALESRRMCAVSVALTDCGVLVVSGTDSAETIFVTESNTPGGPQFDIAQQIGNNFLPLAGVPESLVRRVEVFGGGGDDFLVLQSSGNVGGDVWGGNGNDEIHLEDDGGALSTGHGGDGDDLVAIFAGHGTTAFGDDGNDTLISFEQSNLTLLFGGDGKDTLIGTAHTLMFGGRGNDTIIVS